MRLHTTTLALLVVGLVLGASIGAPHALQPVAAQAVPGTIAYVRGSEIRLIEPDGSNDRAMWSAPAGDPRAPFTITSLDWRPDAGELAFASDHERLTSIFERDLYAVRPNGSGLRKLTNGPTHAELAAFPTGSVTVTVSNLRGGGPYFVYVAGAAEPQTVGGAAGSSHTLTFNNVADWGPGRIQAVVAFFGPNRWFNASGADVQAGRTVSSGTLTIAGAGSQFFGAFLPSWRADGSKLGFMQGCGAIKQVAVSPQPGELGEVAARPNVAGVTCYADWSPQPASANQLLYSDLFMEGHIYRTTEGSNAAGELLVSHAAADLLLDLQWLPDGSGFLYVLATDFSSDIQTWRTANLYRYSFATRATTRLTNFSGELVRGAGVSPDGRTIVFERAATFAGASDLWLMGQDGSNLRLLVNGGAQPDWSQNALPPQPTRRASIPFVMR